MLDDAPAALMALTLVVLVATIALLVPWLGGGRAVALGQLGLVVLGAAAVGVAVSVPGVLAAPGLLALGRRLRRP